MDLDTSSFGTSSMTIVEMFLSKNSWKLCPSQYFFASKTTHVSYQYYSLMILVDRSPLPLATCDNNHFCQTTSNSKICLYHAAFLLFNICGRQSPICSYLPRTLAFFVMRQACQTACGGPSAVIVLNDRSVSVCRSTREKAKTVCLYGHASSHVVNV